MSSLPITDKFLWSVVVLTVSISFQKHPGLSVQVETNFPDQTIYLPSSGRRSAAKVTHCIQLLKVPFFQFQLISDNKLPAFTIEVRLGPLVGFELRELPKICSSSI